MFEKQEQDKIITALPAAIDATVSLLESDDDNVRLQASNFIVNLYISVKSTSQPNITEELHRRFFPPQGDQGDDQSDQDLDEPKSPVVV